MRPMGNHGLYLANARHIMKARGMGPSPVGQTAIADDDARKALGTFRCEPQADERSPVLANERDVGKVERLHPVPDPGDLASIANSRCAKLACPTCRTRSGPARAHAGRPQRRGESCGDTGTTTLARRAASARAPHRVGLRPRSAGAAPASLRDTAPRIDNPQGRRSAIPGFAEHSCWRNHSRRIGSMLSLPCRSLRRIKSPVRIACTTTAGHSSMPVEPPVKPR